jgi:hypothetical protein
MTQKPERSSFWKVVLIFQAFTHRFAVGRSRGRETGCKKDPTAALRLPTICAMGLSCLHRQSMSSFVCSMNASPPLRAILKVLAMPPIDTIKQCAAERLGGRTVPDDLCEMLNAQWRDSAGGKSSRLKSAGATLIEGDRMPELITAICAGRNDLDPTLRMAYAQTMKEMIRYSGLVAEDTAGDSVGTGLARMTSPLKMHRNSPRWWTAWIGRICMRVT